MFIGLAENCYGYKSVLKSKLFNRFVEKFEVDIMLINDVRPLSFLDGLPYLQLDSFGIDGVFLRRLTKLSDKDYQTVTEICESIYCEVMGLKHPEGWTVPKGKYGFTKNGEKIQLIEIGN